MGGRQYIWCVANSRTTHTHTHHYTEQGSFSLFFLSPGARCSASAGKMNSGHACVPSILMRWTSVRASTLPMNSKRHHPRLRQLLWSQISVRSTCWLDGTRTMTSVDLSMYALILSTALLSQNLRIVSHSSSSSPFTRWSEVEVGAGAGGGGRCLGRRHGHRLRHRILSRSILIASLCRGRRQMVV